MQTHNLIAKEQQTLAEILRLSPNSKHFNFELKETTRTLDPAIVDDLGLPPMYVNFIESYVLEDLEIGGELRFRTRLMDFTPESFLECLNGAHFEVMQEYERKDLAAIVIHENGLICVGKQGSSREDQVVLLDTECDSTWFEEEVAPNAFVLVAMAIHVYGLFMLSKNLSTAEKIAETIRVAAEYGCNEAQQRWWARAPLLDN